MASPQCENGFTRIANELLDALCCCCPGGSQGQVFLAILRKTYGWQKKIDNISISQIQKMTRLSRRSVIYAVQNLEAKRMIIVKRKKGRGHINEPNGISIQKKYDSWVVQGISTQYHNTLKQQRKTYVKSKKKVVQGIEGSARIGKKVVQGIEFEGKILAPTKERSTKETIQKKEPFVETSDEVRRNEFNFVIAQKIAEWTRSQKKVNITNSKITAWANQIRLLIEKDLRGEREEKKERVNKALEWYLENAGGEHIVVIESGGSFRDKFIRLETAMKKAIPNTSKWDEVREKYGNQHNH